MAPVVTPVPTPAATPVAHLTAPVKADAVFRAMVAGGLRIATNNASTGGPGREPVKRINATYEGWPLAISEYSTPGALLAGNLLGVPYTEAKVGRRVEVIFEKLNDDITLPQFRLAR